MNKSKRIVITLLSLIGLALSIELCIVFYNANFVSNAAPSICAINDAFDCDSVAKTEYSQFLGVPLSLWGVCLYLFFLFMTYVDKIQNIKGFGIFKVFKNPLAYISCVGIFAFIISMGLGAISVLKIDSVCIFCFMTYFVNLLIGLAAKDWSKSFVYELKTSIADFIEAIKVKKNAFWFVLLSLLLFSILSYTSLTNVLSPQIAKKISFQESFKKYSYDVEGNSIGPKNANVIIHEYVDFNCPGCFMANLYVHRVISEFKNVKAVQHILPLEKTCNHNMQHQGHKNSCLKAKYALAAAKQNKFWQMSDILFFNSPETEKQIIEAARLADFDVKKLREDANSLEMEKEIKDSVLDADSRGVMGTPVMFIGIKQQIGVDTYPEFKQLVIEQGGIEKENHG